MILPVVLAICFLLHVGITEDVTKSRRIIGGEIAPQDKHPFMTGIFIVRVRITLCGGSIIADRWILTAGHCVDGVDVSQLTVFTGDVHYASGEKHLVQDVFTHSDYDRDNNDIALLYLQTTITRGTPVELATTAPPINTKCTIIGWGRTDRYEEARNDAVLREVNVYTTRCDNRFMIDYSNSKGIIENSTVCTSTSNGDGACLGDSGGPLVIGNVLIGIVSTGVPCAVGLPDVFTNVAFYQEWIHNTMRDHN